jgi:hypothetical protein
LDGWGFKSISYKELSKEPVYIPSDTNEQLRKVFINIGSLISGNTNPDLLHETSSILDELIQKPNHQ